MAQVSFTKQQKPDMLESSMGRLCLNLDVLLYNVTTYLIRLYINFMKRVNPKAFV